MSYSARGNFCLHLLTCVIMNVTPFTFKRVSVETIHYMIMLHLNHPKLKSSLVFKYVKPIRYQLTPSLYYPFFVKLICSFILYMKEYLVHSLCSLPLWSLHCSRERTDISSYNRSHMLVVSGYKTCF